MAPLIQNSALQDIHEVEAYIDSRKGEIDTFLKKAKNAVRKYDLETYGYQKQNPYPEKEVLNERYEKWSKKISSYAEEYTKLNEIIESQNKKLTTMKWAVLGYEVIAKIKYLDKIGGENIEIINDQLISKIAKLESTLNGITLLAAEISEEIRIIKAHPHERLKQTINRVNQNETFSTVSGRIYDQTVRNVYAGIGRVTGTS